MKQIEDLLDKIKLYSNLMSESLNADVHGGLKLRKEADKVLESIEEQLKEEV